MAGDWLKMTHALPEKPEVLAIARRTSLNRYEVVGRLFILWRWFDNNTVDGNAVGVTSVTLNECLFGYGDATNFVSAVIAAGWLAEVDDAVRVVKFDEHTSESAKQRAQTAKRVAKSKRKGTGNAELTDEVTLSALPDALPREEKRREELSTSLRSVEEAPKAPRASRKCPPSFVVTTDLIGWASQHTADVEIDRETAKFRDHTFKTAISDWPGAWRNWMRRSQEDRPRARAPLAAESFRERDARVAAERVKRFTGGLAHDRQATGEAPRSPLPFERGYAPPENTDVIEGDAHEQRCIEG